MFIIIRPDGKQYEGQWKEGKMNGKGKSIAPSGKFREGMWENGTRIKWLDSKPNEVYIS